MLSVRFSLAVSAALFLAAGTAHATKAKLDDDACAQLRVEETKFRQAGILNDMSKGPDWAKANLSADRMKEIQHYIQIDEQVRFGCRDAKLSADAEKASEAAARIEINSDADPIAPVVKDPEKPGAKAASKTKAPVHKRTSHKKSKKAPAKSSGLEQPGKRTMPDSAEGTGGAQPVAAAADETGSVGASDEATPKLPAFGFGETVVLPHTSP